jgi:hypothetical protein
VKHETRDVILAAGPSIVALAALWLALWQQLRGFRHERQMHDLADLRALLDAATAAVMDAISGAPDFIRGAMLDEPDAADQEIAWWNIFAAAATMSTRMQLRLGRDHPICYAYDTVLDTLRGTANDVQALRLAGDQHAAIDARGKRGADATSEAYYVYVDAASRIAMVRLP